MKNVDGQAQGDATGAAEGDGSAASQQSATAGSASPQVDPATLLSRLSGLDAKVTSLQQQSAADRAAREAAERKLSEYEAGKVGADEALRAQLAEKDAELAKVRQEARLAGIQSKYPETFGVLGEAAAALTEDQLAASEARMAGTGTPPPPLGTAPARPVSGTTKAIEDMSLAELRNHLKSFPEDVMFMPRGSQQ